MRSPALAIAITGLFAFGCVGDDDSSAYDCPLGSESCSCNSGAACNEGLTCLSGSCVASDEDCYRTMILDEEECWKNHWKCIYAASNMVCEIERDDCVSDLYEDMYDCSTAYGCLDDQGQCLDDCEEKGLEEEDLWDCEDNCWVDFYECASWYDVECFGSCFDGWFLCTKGQARELSELLDCEDDMTECTTTCLD